MRQRISPLVQSRPGSATDRVGRQTFVKWYAKRAQGGSDEPVPVPEPGGLLGPFDALGEPFWVDLDAQEVRFGIFPPELDPDVHVSWFTLPEVLEGYPEHLAIIQAKLAELTGGGP